MARPHVVIRLLVVILASLAGWIGLSQPTVASAAAPSLPSASFACDNCQGASDWTDTITERGPPVACGYNVIAHDAVDYGSRGGLSRFDGSTATNAVSTVERNGETPGAPAMTMPGRRGQAADVDLYAPRGASVAANSADEFVDLASASRRSHILDGEVRPNGSFGGGHRPGTGFPNKSEFPAGWSDDKIMHSISDVATDPSLIWRAGNKPGDFFVNGTRGGIDIEVLIRNNQIWTGYPTNVIRNAP